MSKPLKRVYGMSECPKSVSGHDGGDRVGKCSWCGKKVNPAVARPDSFDVSDLTEAYERHYDPDWDGGGQE